MLSEVLGSQLAIGNSALKTTKLALGETANRAKQRSNGAGQRSAATEQQSEADPRNNGPTEQSNGATEQNSFAEQRGNGAEQRSNGATEQRSGATEQRSETALRHHGGTERSNGATERSSFAEQRGNGAEQRSNGATEQRSNGATEQRSNGAEQRSNGAKQLCATTGERSGATEQQSGAALRNNGGTERSNGATERNSFAPPRGNGATEQRSNGATERSNGAEQRSNGAKQLCATTGERSGATKQQSGATERSNGATERNSFAAQRGNGAEQRSNGAKQLRGTTGERSGATEQRSEAGLHDTLCQHSSLAKVPLIGLQAPDLVDAEGEAVLRGLLELGRGRRQHLAQQGVLPWLSAMKGGQRAKANEIGRAHEMHNKIALVEKDEQSPSGKREWGNKVTKRQRAKRKSHTHTGRTKFCTKLVGAFSQHSWASSIPTASPHGLPFAPQLQASARRPPPACEARTWWAPSRPPARPSPPGKWKKSAGTSENSTSAGPHTKPQNHKTHTHTPTIKRHLPPPAASGRKRAKHLSCLQRTKLLPRYFPPLPAESSSAGL